MNKISDMLISDEECLSQVGKAASELIKSKHKGMNKNELEVHCALLQGLLTRSVNLITERHSNTAYGVMEQVVALDNNHVTARKNELLAMGQRSSFVNNNYLAQ